MSVGRGVGTRDERPRARVGRRFAGEVPRVEFGDGGLEVVEVEHDDRRDSPVGVELDDNRGIDLSRTGVGARGANAR